MYGTNETEASKSALLELGIVLKRYHEDMVLVGGWAPYFITNKFFGHCGSIDIDFVLKTKIMEKYESIRKSILELGYRQEKEFRFLKEVISPVDNQEYAIHIDFLCEKEGLKYAHIRDVQDDLSAFAFDGCDLAFDFNFTEDIETVLPGNGKAKASVKVADLVTSLILKGQAINGRYKPKDFYDVYSLTYFDKTPENAAAYFNKRIEGKSFDAGKSKLISHSISVLKEKFEKEDSIGPYQVELFTNRKFSRMNVFSRVDTFLKEIRFESK